MAKKYKEKDLIEAIELELRNEEATQEQKDEALERVLGAFDEEVNCDSGWTQDAYEYYISNTRNDMYALFHDCLFDPLVLWCMGNDFFEDEDWEEIKEKASLN